MLEVHWQSVPSTFRLANKATGPASTLLVFPLQLLVNRTKRKRRRRADKPLTGSEKVKVINMRTGKKVGSGSFFRTNRLAGLVLSRFVSLVQVGAAFCPILQDLRDYLDQNPDIAVAPDWSENVRKSVRR